jgi:O-antigen/teichoic acid export membrane protein
MVQLDEAQTFRSRLAAVFAGELLNKACVVAAFVWIARRLEPGAYGEVEWALSVTMVAALAADAGLSTWATARVAAAPEEAGDLVARVGWLRLALAGPTYALLLIVAAFHGGDAGAALALYGLLLFLTPAFLGYLFNGLFRSGWVALGQALRGFTFAAAVLLIVETGTPPYVVALAELAGALVLAVCNGVILRSFHLRVRLAASGQRLGALLAQSWTVAAGELTWGVHWYSGVVLLGYVATSTETAWHAAALRLVMAAHTMVWLYLYVLLPNLARLVVIDARAWARALEQSLRLTAWIGCLVALLGTLAAATILTIVFGERFATAAPALQVLIWIIPIVWMGNHLNYSLVAAGYPGKSYLAALSGAATAVIGTVLTGATLGSTGAAIALLAGAVTNALVAVALARGVLPRVGVGASVAPATLACVTCLALGIALTPLAGDIAAALTAGAALFAVAMYAERKTAVDFLRAVAADGTFQPAGAVLKRHDA